MNTFLLATGTEAIGFLTMGLITLAYLLYRLLQSLGELKVGIIGNHLFMNRNHILVWPWETLHTMDRLYIDDGQRIYHFNTMDGKKVSYKISGALTVIVQKLTAEAIRDRLDICCLNNVNISLEQIVSDHIIRLRLKDLKPQIDLHWTDIAPLRDAAGVYWTGHVSFVNGNTIPETFSDGCDLDHFTSKDGYQVGIGWQWTAALTDMPAARLLSGNHNTEPIENAVRERLTGWVSSMPITELVEKLAGPGFWDRPLIPLILNEDPLEWHIGITPDPKVEIVGPEPPKVLQTEEEITAATANM